MRKQKYSFSETNCLTTTYVPETCNTYAEGHTKVKQNKGWVYYMQNKGSIPPNLTAAFTQA